MRLKFFNENKVNFIYEVKKNTVIQRIEKYNKYDNDNNI